MIKYLKSVHSAPEKAAKGVRYGRRIGSVSCNPDRCFFSGFEVARVWSSRAAREHDPRAWLFSCVSERSRSESTRRRKQARFW